MQSKTTMKYHYVSIRTARIKCTILNASEDVGKLDLLFLGNIKYYSHSVKLLGSFLQN